MNTLASTPLTHPSMTRVEGEAQYLASGSSKVSRFSHRVEMMLSYLLGYLRKMSLITTMASCTT